MSAMLDVVWPYRWYILYAAAAGVCLLLALSGLRLQAVDGLYGPRRPLVILAAISGALIALQPTGTGIVQFLLERAAEKGSGAQLAQAGDGFMAAYEAVSHPATAWPLPLALLTLAPVIVLVWGLFLPIKRVVGLVGVSCLCAMSVGTALALPWLPHARAVAVRYAHARVPVPVLGAAVLGLLAAASMPYMEAAAPGSFDWPVLLLHAVVVAVPTVLAVRPALSCAGKCGVPAATALWALAGTCTGMYWLAVVRAIAAATGASSGAWIDGVHQYSNGAQAAAIQAQVQHACASGTAVPQYAGLAMMLANTAACGVAMVESSFSTWALYSISWDAVFTTLFMLSWLPGKRIVHLTKLVLTGPAAMVASTLAEEFASSVTFVGQHEKQL